MIKFALSLRLRDFFPEQPKVAEYTTSRTMGQDCENMTARFGVSREEQDVFAARSHQLAGKAAEAGHLGKEIVKVSLPPSFKPIESDNGVRPDTQVEKIAKLRPAFDKKHGTLTAANSSFLTDGAAAVLIMSEAKAKELGLQPKAEIVDFVFTGQSLDDELLLGPAFAVSRLLDKCGMTLEQMDVIEFHEAFAGQILANIKCLASDEFAKEKLGREKAVGMVNMDKFNLWGGSLSIGHPFGATGARLLTTASNRLIEENGTYALIAACAAGAHGHAMVVRRYAR
jgi:acetyl-CoA acyltransferase